MVPDLLARSALDRPDAPALISDGRTWSYAELWEGAVTAAGSLRRSGIGPGDAVAIALANGAEFFLAFFGTLLAGGVAVPVFPRSSAERIGTLAGLAGASVLVAASEQQALAGLTCLTPADLARPGSPGPAPADPDQPCYIQYTSGSTADPRGVIITHRALLANIAQMTEAMGITSGDVFVSWLPTYHDMGLTLMALTPFSLGARLVLLPTDLRDVASWLRAVQAHRGTFTAGPDFAYRLCLRHVADSDRFDLSSLQVCMNASEPVRAATLAGFEKRFGLHNVMMTGYGLAEATLSVTCTRRGRPAGTDERGLVCLGEPMPGTTVQIVGPRAMAPGEVGEIVVAGPSTCQGYHGNPAATAALTWGDGYVRTGDLGYLDGSGRLYFVARRKDVIKLAGRTLYPQEVEAVADAVPGVRYSAAAGIDRGGLAGEGLYVFAEVRDSASDGLRTTAIEIVRAIHRALGVRPRGTILLRPGSIPLTSNGKLQRGRLRDAFTDGRLDSGIIFPAIPAIPARAAGRHPRPAG